MLRSRETENDDDVIGYISIYIPNVYRNIVLDNIVFTVNISPPADLIK